MQVDEVKARMKRELRKRMRGLRIAIPEAAREERSRRIAMRVESHPWFQQAKGIGLYWPMLDKGEVDLRELAQAARQQNKRVYYPFMAPSPEGFSTGFRETRSDADLLEQGNGFFEPRADLPLGRRGDLDLILVPALAASTDGHRIGYGVGFYDVTLPDFCPPARTIITVYQFQIIAEALASEHDCACQAVVTDGGMWTNPELDPSEGR